MFVARSVIRRALFACLMLTAFAAFRVEPSSAAPPSNAPIVGMARSPNNAGYWMVASDGGVFSFGAVQFYGSMGGQHLQAPIVGMAATPDGGGYWLVASDGGIFAYGNARFFGSLGSTPHNGSIVGMAASPDGGGYWLVGSDGGVYAYGNARFLGSAGSVNLKAPVVGMARTPDGGGYWLAASDGGIFAYGNARFFGSMGSAQLQKPVVGIAARPDGSGYYMVAADGGIFAFPTGEGGIPFYGSMGGKPLNGPMVGIEVTPDGGGYWMDAVDGGLFAFGSANWVGNVNAPVPTGGNVPGTPSAIRDKIVAIARGQLGYTEDPQGSNCVERYNWCHGKGQDTSVTWPWCSVFASWVWAQAGVPSVSQMPYSGSFIDWATPKGLWKPGTSSPQVGDAAVFGPTNGRKVHVALVSAVYPDGRIELINGNESNKVAVTGPAAPSELRDGGYGIVGFASPVSGGGATPSAKTPAATAAEAPANNPYTYVPVPSAEDISAQDPGDHPADVPSQGDTTQGVHNTNASQGQTQTTVKASVALPKRVSLDHKGRLSVKLRCASAACAGRLTVRVGHARMTVAVKLAAGTARTLRIKPTRAARKALRHKRVKVSLTLTLTGQSPVTKKAVKP